MLFDALLASLAIAALSLAGVFIFGARGHIAGTNRYIIPIAIGVFLGVVFFELIPETLEAAGTLGSIAIAGGFLAFYLLSHLLHTYHHHHDSHEEDACSEDRKGASLLLIGDAVHNLADGVVIATAFLVNPAVGVATTIGVALHEIPQEIAEFGVLLRAGYSKRRAALYNFLSASSVVLGVIITFVVATTIEGYVWVLTGIAAGNLLFIAASDLIPNLAEEHQQNGRFLNSFIMTLLGLVVIVSLLEWSHEEFGLEHSHEEEVHDEYAHDAEPL